MRYGIYGGAFDPVHYGHLLLAECCLRQERLDKVYFVPTGLSPHRSGKSSYCASAADRFAMLRLAVADCPEFEISRIELDKKETSYTVETLREFRRQFPDAELFLLIGNDTFHDLPNWRESEAVRKLAVPLTVGRPNVPPPAAGNPFQQHLVEMPLMELSSTAVRKAVAQHRSIRFQVPPSVERYIAENGLYRTSETEATATAANRSCSDSEPSG